MTRTGYSGSGPLVVTRSGTSTARGAGSGLRPRPVTELGPPGSWGQGTPEPPVRRPPPPSVLGVLRPVRDGGRPEQHDLLSDPAGHPGRCVAGDLPTILYRMVPKDKLGAAMGMYGLGIVVAPGVGPTLGGYLVEYVDWRLIFYINVPVGILGAIAAMAVLPRVPGVAGRRFDLPGFGCIAVGLFSLLLALSEGQDWGWTGYRVLLLLAVSVNALALFVVIELQAKEPLLNVRVFRYWPFVNSLLLLAILSVGLFAVLFYVPSFLQEAQGLTPMNTGLTVLPQALVMMVMMPLAGRLYDLIGPRWPAIIGLFLNGVGTLMLAGINIDMTRPELIVWMMIRAAGLGLSMMPIMTGGLSALPAALSSAGSAFNTLTQRVSSALGLAVLTALATVQEAQFMADRSALVPADGPYFSSSASSLSPGWDWRSSFATESPPVMVVNRLRSAESTPVRNLF
jgi:EmrB/QacA subfamily drug resistance transporter